MVVDYVFSQIHCSGGVGIFILEDCAIVLSIVFLLYIILAFVVGVFDLLMG
jgi:hypothetical protein